MVGSKRVSVHHVGACLRTQPACCTHGATCSAINEAHGDTSRHGGPTYTDWQAGQGLILGNLALSPAPPAPDILPPCPGEMLSGYCSPRRCVSPAFSSPGPGSPAKSYLCSSAFSSPGPGSPAKGYVRLKIRCDFVKEAEEVGY